MKAGFKTSEFYIALVGIGGILYTFVQQSCNFSTDKVMALAGVVISYVASRSYLKGKQTQQTGV